MKVLYIPYFQTSRYRVQAMIDLAKPQLEDKMADLGSGDGRIAIAFGQAGIEAHGYELDPTLLTTSNENIKKAHLEKSVFIHNKDFWQGDVSKYTIVAVYGMPDIMEALEQKFQKELTPGSQVLSNYYQFPNWKYTAMKDNIYLYKK